ncbi:hypothetical protein BH11ACT8_BH11ACT8_15390 [soil metagenome]
MFISHVDAALEQLLRERLPLDEEYGDVSFEVPSSTWAAQLSRITVNLFLYDVQRSSQPSRAMTVRTENGAQVRRRPQPMVQLGYLVSAWAGSPRDEHQLLGDLVSLLAGLEAVPADLLSPDLSSSVQLSIGDDRASNRELWSAAGGTLKPAVAVLATVASDTFDFEEMAPAVERISAMANRMKGPRP